MPIDIFILIAGPDSGKIEVALPVDQQVKRRRASELIGRMRAWRRI